MLGTRWALAAMAALLAATAAVVVNWQPWSPGASTVATPHPLHRPAFLDQVGPAQLTPPGGSKAAAPTPSVADATAPVPAPAPTAVVERGSGRRLVVGFAGSPGSPAMVADALGSQVGLYSSPGQAEPDDVMDNPTWEGLPVVFLVHQRQGDWLQVQVSMRPNGATAWIRAGDVSLRQVSTHILVDLNAKTLTAYNGQNVVLQASVAPGRDDTPTPTGDFFIDGMVAPPDPTGPYGPYQISVSGFSNVYTTFGGGIGQIAIHGTNNPALIGTPASNGCVRMNNEDIAALVSLVPVGTPVRIVG